MLFKSSSDPKDVPMNHALLRAQIDKVKDNIYRCTYATVEGESNFFVNLDELGVYSVQYLCLFLNHKHDEWFISAIMEDSSRAKFTFFNGKWMTDIGSLESIRPLEELELMSEEREQSDDVTQYVGASLQLPPGEYDIECKMVSDDPNFVHLSPVLYMNLAWKLKKYKRIRFTQSTNLSVSSVFLDSKGKGVKAKVYLRVQRYL